MGFTPSGHSAASMPIADGSSVTMRAVPPSALNVLPSAFWYGVSVISGSGSHARVIPAGASTSTLVVTSKVRQASLAAKPRAEGRVNPAAAIPVDWRKCRRFIHSSLTHCYARRESIPARRTGGLPPASRASPPDPKVCPGASRVSGGYLMTTDINQS